jgi:cytochrome c5
MNSHTKTVVTSLSLLMISAMPSVGMATNVEDIQMRVQKVGKLNVEGQTAQSAPAASATTDNAPADPATAYQASCFACHGTGVAGAPVLGDKEAWSARIAQGEATLNDHAINGFNAMPPRGGSSLDDETLKLIVAHMIEKSQ